MNEIYLRVQDLCTSRRSTLSPSRDTCEQFHEVCQFHIEYPCCGAGLGVHGFRPFIPLVGNSVISTGVSYLDHMDPLSAEADLLNKKENAGNEFIQFIIDFSTSGYNSSIEVTIDGAQYYCAFSSVLNAGLGELVFAEKELFDAGTLWIIQNMDLKNSTLPPDELLSAVKAKVDEFIGNEPQFDDMTMLALEYK